MAMFAEDAWKERLNWREEVVVVLRRELESCLLNIFKGWRGARAGFNILPHRRNVSQLEANMKVPTSDPESGRELRVAAALDAVLVQAVLQACRPASRHAWR